MIIGRGMIATRFSNDFAADDRYLLFASGVADSKEESQEPYLREKKLLVESIAANPDKLLIYFSTYSVLDPSLQNQAYIKHKLAMEKLISDSAKSWLIIRAGNIVGKTNNKKTVFSFFKTKIESGEVFECWNKISRNLLDVNDLLLLLKEALQRDFRNRIVNLVNPNPIAVKALLIAMETRLNRNANVRYTDSGSYFHPDSSEVHQLNSTLGINFEPGFYLQKLVDSYGLS